MTAVKRPLPKQRKLLREEKKRADQERKNARLLNRPEFKTVPRIQEKTEGDKIPRISEDPGSIMQKLMEWDDSKGDITGTWSWGQQRNWHEKNDWHTIIYPNLCEFAKLTWAQISDQRTGDKTRHKKHHDMNLYVIEREAIDRWLELGLDEHETLYRFRLGNCPRLWGFRISSKFFVVWWDKFHKIYPVGC